MRTSVKFLFAALITLTSLATLVAQQNQKPGKWQITMEMEMASGKMPPVTQEVCLSEADVADPTKSAMMQGCTISDDKTKGNTRTFTLDCPAQQMKGTGSITFSGDTFTGETKLKIAGQDVTAKQTGKWLGTCTK